MASPWIGNSFGTNTRETGKIEALEGKEENIYRSVLRITANAIKSPGLIPPSLQKVKVERMNRNKSHIRKLPLSLLYLGLLLSGGRPSPLGIIGTPKCCSIAAADLAEGRGDG